MRQDRAHKVRLFLTEDVPRAKDDQKQAADSAEQERCGCCAGEGQIEASEVTG